MGSMGQLEVHGGANLGAKNQDGLCRNNEKFQEIKTLMNTFPLISY